MAKEQESYLFTDWPVQVVAIDYSGQFVALPGRGGLALVDLTQSKEDTCIRKITRQSKWDCNAIEWNPHDFLRHCLASTSNTKVELWTWREGSGSKEQDLRAHTRAISDLNWSNFEPNLLATCSYDSYIYIWDIRDCRKPKALSTVSGASQVKWNSGVGHILATSHDGDVRIWDLRKGSAPMIYISAHLSKINGLDWSPIDGQKLLTCSLDHAVKLWDVFDDARNAKAICDLRAPVWRAKYTPLGNAILTVPLSTASQRTINVPYLWNIGNLKNPFQTFNGATSVLDFQWRRSQGDREFQLLTWSRDQMLKLWNLDPRCWQLTTPQDVREEHKSKLSSFDPISSPETLEFSSSSEDVVTDPVVTSERDSVMLSGVGQPHNLEEEFAYVHNAIPNLVVEKEDITNRSCIVSVNSGNNNCKMMIAFPSLYPDNAMPSFEFTDDSPLDSATKVKIIKVLREKAESFVKNNERCLEPCLNSLVTGLEDLKIQESNTPVSQHPAQFIPMYSVGLDTAFGLQDAAIPFPRTSAATFCASGLLVCFSRSTRSMSRKREITPRSLSALSAYTSRSLSSFYNSETLKPGVTKSGSARKALVILRDSSPLMASHLLLAQNYCIFGVDAEEFCEKNKKAAMMVGRQDLVHSWSLLALIMDSKLTPSPSSSEAPWASHAFGRKLINSLVDYYIKISDIQMLAMISIFLSYQKFPDFGGNTDTAQESNQRSYLDSRSFSMLSDESPNFEVATPESYSSHSPSFTIIDLKNPADVERRRHVENCSFIGKEKRELFDHFKLCYAELLYKWQLMNRRSEVLKFVVKPQTFHRHKDFSIKCSFCQEYFSGPHCTSCKKFGFRCVICRLPVKGSHNFCLSCGHGGHTLHILKWFETNDVCASGCGCQCPKQSSLIEPQ